MTDSTINSDYIELILDWRGKYPSIIVILLNYPKIPFDSCALFTLQFTSITVSSTFTSNGAKFTGGTLNLPAGCTSAFNFPYLGSTYVFTNVVINNAGTVTYPAAVATAAGLTINNSGSWSWKMDSLNTQGTVCPELLF